MADEGANQIVKLSAYYNNEFWQTNIPYQTNLLRGIVNPWALAVDGSGNIFVAGNYDSNNSADGVVYKLTPYSNGYWADYLPGNWVDPNGIAVDAAGDIYVADDDWGGGNGFVAKLTPSLSGGVPTYTQSTLIPSSQVSSPEGVTLDQKGNLYVVDGASATSNAYKFDFADPLSLSFASTDVGSTNADGPNIVDLLNTGNAPLNIAAVGFPAGFPEDASGAADCAAGAILAPASNCTLTIDFQPQTAGSNSASVWLVDNALNVAYAKQSLSMSGFGFGIAASITSPGPGTTLPGASATFTWSKGDGVSEYWLYVGTNGAGSANIYNSSAVTNFANVTNLPIYGQTVYVRLLSKIAGVWQYIDYLYTAAGTSGVGMISPAPGSTLPGSSTTFTWTKGNSVSEYWLYIGTKGAGSTDVYNSSVFTTSANVTTLPVNGATVYVRLLSKINGAWQYIDYTYTAQ